MSKDNGWILRYGIPLTKEELMTLMKTSVINVDKNGKPILSRPDKNGKFIVKNKKKKIG